MEPVKVSDKDGIQITSSDIGGGKRGLDVKVTGGDIATMQDDIALIKADIAAIRVIMES